MSTDTIHGGSGAILFSLIVILVLVVEEDVTKMMVYVSIKFDNARKLL